MNKKTTILVIKIVAVLIWLAALLAPSVYSSTEKIEMVDFNIQTDIYPNVKTYEFVVEFDKEVVEGEITMGFYDESGKLLFKETGTFKKNDSKTATVLITSDKFVSEYDALAEYKFEGAEVTTKTANLLNTVMYPVAIVLAVALVFVLRLQYKEYEVDGKLIQIYAGVLQHTVYVDNIQAYGEKYLFTNKKTMLTIPVSNEHEMQIVFRANNRIEAMTQNRPIIQNGDVVENPTEAVTFESLSQPAASVVQTASVEPEVGAAREVETEGEASVQEPAAPQVFVQAAPVAEEPAPTEISAEADDETKPQE